MARRAVMSESRSTARSKRVALTCSKALASAPGLATFVDADEVRVGEGGPATCVVATSCDPRSTQLARELGVPRFCVDAGLLAVRSGSRPLTWSLQIDDLAPHYDATRPSRLESILERGGELDIARATRCIERIVRHRLSREPAPVRELGPSARVLVVHERADDPRVRLSRAAPDAFAQALATARHEHPGAEIAVLGDPRSREVRDAARLAKARVLRQPIASASLLAQVEHVYVTQSPIGFEALLRGLPVSCFGLPFYAGWGATIDRKRSARRTARRSVAEIFAAACILQSRYVDHETGARCEIERVLEHLELQAAHVEPNVELAAMGFSPWKQVFVPRFLGAPNNAVRCQYVPTPPPSHSRVVVWSVGKNRVAEALAQRAAVPVWRMEDGFLRSVGLGSDSYAPSSLVLDRRGIYFDPTRASDLEVLLETAEFDEPELVRARELRAQIVALNVSKYNVGTLAPFTLPPEANGRRVALVIGQVEDDASIRLGCVDLRRNADLLRAARERDRETFIVYKPHPDVTSGNRRGAIEPRDLAAWSDLVVTDVGIGACLAVADEVHTLTSLVGFEALLRHKRVFVYGLPFYAGWGLTDDRHPHPRRTRRRTLDELVAATLLRYPRYVHPRTSEFTTPEAIVRCLVEKRANARPTKPYDHYRIVRLARKAAYIASGGRFER